jgi:hypothetical protein
MAATFTIDGEPIALPHAIRVASLRGGAQHVINDHKDNRDRHLPGAVGEGLEFSILGFAVLILLVART